MKRVRLGDVCQVISGATPKSGNPAFWGGEIPWVTPAELDDDSHLICKTERCLTEAGFKSASLHMMPVGTVLLSTRAPIGKTAITGIEMCCNQGFKNLVCGDEISNEYLYRFLKSNTTALQARGRGATFKELSKREVERFLIPLPSLERQRECTSKLEAIENEIKQAKAQSTSLDELVKARFVEMFGEEDGRHQRLKDCCTKVMGGKTPSMKHPEYYGGKIPFIKSGDVKEDTVSSGTLWLSDVAIDKASVKLVPADAILVVTRSALLRRRVCTSICTRNVAINQDIRAFIPRPEFDSWYLLWSIRAHEPELLSHVRSVNTSGMDIKQLYDLSIFVPPLPLQQEFAAFVAQVDQLKADTQLAIDKLQMLYNSLAQEYFSE